LLWCFLCRFDPLWNSLVVGGVKSDGTPYLGTVGMIGTAFTDLHVATGAAPLQTCALWIIGQPLRC